MWGLEQHTSLDIVVGLCGASGNTLLILGIVVGLCASGNTLLGIAVGLCGVLLLVMWHLGQHTLLGIVVGL
jgi:hypothetical protein